MDAPSSSTLTSRAAPSDGRARGRSARSAAWVLYAACAACAFARTGLLGLLAFGMLTLGTGAALYPGEGLRSWWTRHALLLWLPSFGYLAIAPGWYPLGVRAWVLGFLLPAAVAWGLAWVAWRPRPDRLKTRAFLVAMLLYGGSAYVGWCFAVHLELRESL